MRKECEELRRKLGESARKDKRQAAPFRRRKHQEKPKKPGRKEGHEASHRPPPEKVDQVLDAKLPACPCCAGELVDRKVDEQFEIELPPVEAVVTKFVIESGYCQRCAERFQGRHPQQTSDALGAANIHLGPRAVAMAAEMKHRLGVPYAKIRDLYANYLDINIVPATLCRAEQRLAAKAEPSFELLKEALRRCGVVHADETGWRISRLGAYLWVFSSKDVTVYAIGSRGGIVPEEMLGAQFEGVLVVDGYAAYDALECRKGRCVGHILRRASDLAENSLPNDARYLRRLIDIFKDGIALDKRRGELTEVEFAAEADAIDERLGDWLSFFGYKPSEELKTLVRHLRKHREEWLTFLREPEVPPTNNHAERMIRPSVVVRKTGGCNKTTRGARTHEVLVSLMVTARQQGKRFVDFAIQLLRGPTVPIDLATLPDG